MIDLRTVNDWFTCCYCKRRQPGDLFSRDHILPKSWGGSDDPNNLRQPCCRPCNGLMEQAAECPCTLACARAVAEHFDPPNFEQRMLRRVRKILSEWRPWQ